MMLKLKTATTMGIKKVLGGWSRSCPRVGGGVHPGIVSSSTGYLGFLLLQVDGNLLKESSEMADRNEAAGVSHSVHSACMNHIHDKGQAPGRLSHQVAASGGASLVTNQLVSHACTHTEDWTPTRR